MSIRRVLFAITLVLALAAASTGCRADTGPVDRPPAEQPSAPSENPEPAGEPVALDELAISLTRVVSGFTRPLLVTHAGDGSGRLFVVEQLGRIRVVREGEVAKRAFLDLTRQVSDGGERGLLGLAFAPDYEMSGRFYVNYTDREGDTIVARYTADDPASDSPKLSAPQTVLKVDQPYANHNGGCIVFAPDGTLLVGMGDGGSGGDPDGRAQDDGELLGKIVALDVTGTARPTPRIVAKGLRNPWRFSFDRATDDVWIADVGQNAVEEVNVVAWDELEGSNFGWNLWEGDRAFGSGKRSRTGLTFPAFTHPRDEAQSITGGFVYRGANYPALQGTYVYADFMAGWIGAARADAGGRVGNRIVLDPSGIVPSSFGEGEDGELYVCDYEAGAVMQVEAGRRR